MLTALALLSPLLYLPVFMADKLVCSIDVRLAGLPSPRGPASTIVTKVVFADNRSIHITPCSEYRGQIHMFVAVIISIVPRGFLVTRIPGATGGR